MSELPSEMNKLINYNIEHLPGWDYLENALFIKLELFSGRYGYATDYGLEFKKLIEWAIEKEYKSLLYLQNSRGDRVFHVAAICGLLDKHHLEIYSSDIVDSWGNTVAHWLAMTGGFAKMGMDVKQFSSAFPKIWNIKNKNSKTPHNYYSIYISSGRFNENYYPTI